MALLAGGAIGLACVFLIDSFGATSKLGAALLNMAVFGAVISYSMVMLAYIKLKITRKDLARPYKSPLGIGGAIVGTVLALVALGACFANPDFRSAVWATAIFLLGAIAYFMIYSRTRLVAQAPEERVALERAAAASNLERYAWWLMPLHEPPRTHRGCFRQRTTPAEACVSDGAVPGRMDRPWLAPCIGWRRDEVTTMALLKNLCLLGIVGASVTGCYAYAGPPRRAYYPRHERVVVVERRRPVVVRERVVVREHRSWR